MIGLLANPGPVPCRDRINGLLAIPSRACRPWDRMMGLLAQHGHGQTTPVAGALRHDRMTAPMVRDGPMHGTAFQA